MIGHECEFPEVLVEPGDFADGDALQPGMKVLAPCSCGETPLENLEFIQGRIDEMQAALLAYEPHRALYHWSPRSRRKQIIRHGLRPGMRLTTTSSPMGGMAICFADSPSWAWALSGGMRWTPDGEWDLWQTWLDRLTEPVVLADENRPSGVYEIRTGHRVYKRDLWLVGSRTR